MPEVTLGITRLHELLGRDYGIEEPYWVPSIRTLMRVRFFFQIRLHTHLFARPYRYKSCGVFIILGHFKVA